VSHVRPISFIFMSSHKSTESKHVKHASSKQGKLTPKPKFLAVNRFRMATFHRTIAPQLHAVTKQLREKRTPVIDGYVTVVQDGKDSKSTADDVTALTLQLSLLRTAARASIGSSHIVTNLYASGSASAGAGAVLPLAFGLQPSTATEWAGYALLYDECRVKAVKFMYQITSASANVAEPCFYAIGYDSTYGSTPSSVLDVMESQQHEVGALAITTPGSTSALTATPTGLRHFHIRIPRQPVANAAPVTGGTGIIPNFPGEWMAAGDTADTVGYLRIYIERAGGSTSVAAISYKIVFECEWRERT